MKKEFPLPDDRLAGTVTLEQVMPSIKRDILCLASLDGRTIEIERPDAKNEISRLAALGKLEYES
jgi:hypothetical protein